MIPAERLRISVADCRSLKHNGSTLSFTVSIGLTASRAGDNPACILWRAQQALKAAIEAGGNRAYSHDGSVSDSVSGASGWVGLEDLPQDHPTSLTPDG